MREWTTAKMWRPFLDLKELKLKMCNSSTVIVKHRQMQNAKLENWNRNLWSGFKSFKREGKDSAGTVQGSRVRQMSCLPCMALHCVHSIVRLQQLEPGALSPQDSPATATRSMLPCLPTWNHTVNEPPSSRFKTTWVWNFLHYFPIY